MEPFSVLNKANFLRILDWAVQYIRCSFVLSFSVMVVVVMMMIMVVVVIVVVVVVIIRGEKKVK